MTPTNTNQIHQLSAGGATRFQGTINEPGTVTVNGQAAAMSTSTNFVANPVLSSGTNTVAVVARDGSGNVATNNYQVVVPPQGTVSPTYDSAGNMTNNGSGQTYTWDAENRLTKITQGSNTYQFAYDGLGRRISETDNSTLTKQWVWVGTTMAEERASNGTTVTKRFYAQGEQIGGSAYFYTRDHLGSVREMTDSSGTAIQARYDYDPYGRVTPVGTTTIASDFQYAGYYEHASSGLNLTLFRAYDPNTAKWLSRDPIAEKGGINLYDYVLNNPILFEDPLGLCRTNLDRAGQLLIGVGNLALSLAMAIGAAGTSATGVGIGAGILLGIGAGTTFTYGMANIGGAFTPDTPEGNALSETVEGMPSTLNQAVGSAIAGPTGQTVGAGLDFSTELGEGNLLMQSESDAEQSEGLLKGGNAMGEMIKKEMEAKKKADQKGQGCP